MIDREKTIRDLETIGAWHTHHYEPFHYECAETIHNALELLREKEPVEPFHVCADGQAVFIVDKKHTFCPYCGRAVKWNG